MYSYIKPMLVSCKNYEIIVILVKKKKKLWPQVRANRFLILPEKAP